MVLDSVFLVVLQCSRGGLLLLVYVLAVLASCSLMVEIHAFDHMNGETFYWLLCRCRVVVARRPDRSMTRKAFSCFQCNMGVFLYLCLSLIDWLRDFSSASLSMCVCSDVYCVWRLVCSQFSERMRAARPRGLRVSALVALRV